MRGLNQACQPRSMRCFLDGAVHHDIYEFYSKYRQNESTKVQTLGAMNLCSKCGILWSLVSMSIARWMNAVCNNIQTHELYSKLRTVGAACSWIVNILN